MADFDRGNDGSDRPVVATTGFAQLDDAVPLRAGQVTLVASRPAVGKSFFLQNVLLSNLRRRPVVPSVYVALESSRHDVEQRLLSILSRIPLTLVRNGELADREMARLDSLIRARPAWPLGWVEAGCAGLDRLLLETWEVARWRGAKLIVIDGPLPRGDSQFFGQAHGPGLPGAVRALRWLAAELGAVVLIEGQVGRAVESRQNKRPRLPADLRGGRRLAGEGDSTFALYRQHVYEPWLPDSEGLLEVAPRRHNGTQGPWLPLRFDPRTGHIGPWRAEG